MIQCRSDVLLLDAAISIDSQLNERWALRGLFFYDDLHFSGGRDERPLQTLFSPATPIERPVAAVFTGLDGRARNYADRKAWATLRAGRHRRVRDASQFFSLPLQLVIGLSLIP